MSSRAACLEDFLGEDTNSNNNKYDKNDRNTIWKNQQEFGDRKRIKP